MGSLPWMWPQVYVIDNFSTISLIKSANFSWCWLHQEICRWFIGLDGRCSCKIQIDVNQPYLFPTFRCWWSNHLFHRWLNSFLDEIQVLNRRFLPWRTSGWVIYDSAVIMIKNKIVKVPCGEPQNARNFYTCSTRARWTMLFCTLVLCTAPPTYARARSQARS